MALGEWVMQLRLWTWAQLGCGFGFEPKWARPKLPMKAGSG
jgi:hypothetical protein